MRAQCVCPLLREGICRADSNDPFEPTPIEKKRYCFTSHYHLCYILNGKLSDNQGNIGRYKNRMELWKYVESMKGLA